MARMLTGFVFCPFPLLPLFRATRLRKGAYREHLPCRKRTRTAAHATWALYSCARVSCARWRVLLSFEQRQGVFSFEQKQVLLSLEQRWVWVSCPLRRRALLSRPLRRRAVLSRPLRPPELSVVILSTVRNFVPFTTASWANYVVLGPVETP